MESCAKRLSRASRGCVQRMQFVYEALVERISGVDFDAVFCDDVIVFEANAANAWLSRIGLKVEHHSFLKHDRGIFRCRAEVWRFPRINARAVAQAVQHVRIGRGENVRVGRSGTYLTSGVEKRVVALLMKITHFGCGLY